MTDKLKDLRAPMTDEEELEMIASTERGEWVSADLSKEERERWQKLARAHIIQQRKRISIAVPERDLLKLKAKAMAEGIPYQTLINSIIHKYVEGSLK